MKNEDITKKINDIDSITNSQVDRFTLQSQISNNLFTFLQSVICKANSESELKRKVQEQILSRMEPDETGTINISTGALIKLLEVLSRSDNEIINGVLNILKENQKVIIENNPTISSSKTQTEFTSDEVEKTKKLLSIYDLVEKIKNTELSLDELEKNPK